VQILMSATMKEDAFSAYFGRCPIAYVSGRSYPVTQHYLGDVHELVGRGQRQQAVEAGKLPPGSEEGGGRGKKGGKSGTQLPVCTVGFRAIADIPAIACWSRRGCRTAAA
jgi:hypothetical protein